MTAHRKPGAPKGDYAVGYGRPPTSTRFQKGQSGNPRGRPKGAKSFAQVLNEKFARRVTVQENGRRRQMRMLEVVIERLINDAARGNLRATRLAVDLWERCGDVADQHVAVADLAAEDRATIAAYFQRVQSETVGEDAPLASRAGRETSAKAPSSQRKGINHDRES